MTTLIAVYNSSGLIGRCDAKCYNATHPDCDCVCGGMNHGAGLSKALENTQEHAEKMLETYAQERGLRDWKGTVPAQNERQLSLFDLVKA